MKKFLISLKQEPQHVLASSEQIRVLATEACLGLYQTSMVEVFRKLANDF